MLLQCVIFGFIRTINNRLCDEVLNASIKGGSSVDRLHFHADSTERPMGDMQLKEQGRG